MDDRIILKDINNEIWNRLLNEIPYLYKSKGTIRSIRSIINCHGIPSSMLDIKEYSQHDDIQNELYNNYNIDTFLYSLKFSGTEYVEFPWAFMSTSTAPIVNLSTEVLDPLITEDSDFLYLENTPTPVGVELFFYTNNPADRSTLININDTIKVDLIKVDSTYSYFEISMQTGSFASDTLIKTSSNYTIADGIPNHLLLQKYSGDEYEFNFNKLSYNDVLYKEQILISDLSGSLYNNYWAGSGTIKMGEDFVGNIFEFRLWSSYLQEFTVENHTKFPQAVFSNYTTGSYDDLIFHASFNNPTNHFISSSYILHNEAYNDSLYGNATVNFYNWSNESTFPYNYSSTNVNTLAKSINTGVSIISSNKIRIDDNWLISGSSLNPFNSVEDSTYKNRKDPFTIGVYLSPTNIINDDMIRHLGISDIGELVGDPRDRYESEYSTLNNLKSAYWSWGAVKNSFNDYLDYVKSYDLKGLFSSIENMLPARSYAIIGILYEQTLLERTKLKKFRPVSNMNQLEMSVIESKDFSEVLNTNVLDIDASVNIDSYNLKNSYDFEKSNIYNKINVFESIIGDSLGSIAPNIVPVVNFETNLIYVNGVNMHMSNDQIFDGAYSKYHYKNYLGYTTSEKRLKYIGCLNNVNNSYNRLEPVQIYIVEPNKIYVKKTGKSNLETN